MGTVRSAIYSDDHGATWQMSALITPGANECQVVELSDGSLKMNIRMQTYSEGLRGISVSGDGGHSWSEVVHDANLPCPEMSGEFGRRRRPVVFFKSGVAYAGRKSQSWRTVLSG